MYISLIDRLERNRERGFSINKQYSLEHQQDSKITKKIYKNELKIETMNIENNAISMDMGYIYHDVDVSVKNEYLNEMTNKELEYIQIHNNKEEKLDDISNNYERNSTTKTKTNKQKKEVFEMPSLYEHEKLKTERYTLRQLKEICKYYKLHVSGTKQVLIERCYTYLKHSIEAIKIQKLYRGHLIRKYIQSHGVGLQHPYIQNKDRNRDKQVVNDTDFLTMENIDTLHHYEYFSFEEDAYIYVFHVCSFHNLRMNSDAVKGILNPYTRNRISRQTIEQFNNLLRYINILKYPLILDLDNPIQTMKPEDKLKQRVYDVFQCMDELGNYTNPDWFLQLNTPRILKFIRELYDIWNYRSGLSQVDKQNICAPNGNPFVNQGLPSIQILHIRNPDEIKESAIKIIENLVYNGTNNQNKGLGSMYVLTALTLVSYEASVAMPWLFEAVL